MRSSSFTFTAITEPFSVIVKISPTKDIMISSKTSSQAKSETENGKNLIRVENRVGVFRKMWCGSLLAFDTVFYLGVTAVLIGILFVSMAVMMHEEMEPESVEMMKTVVVTEIFVVFMILMDKLRACCTGWQENPSYRVIWLLVYMPSVIPMLYENSRHEDLHLVCLSLFILWSFLFGTVGSYFPEEEVRTKTSKSSSVSGKNIYGTMEKLDYVTIDVCH